MREPTPFKTMLTAGDGTYLFSDLEPATYEIVVDETTTGGLRPPRTPQASKTRKES